MNLGILQGDKAPEEYTGAEVSEALGGVTISDQDNVSKAILAVVEDACEVGTASCMSPSSPGLIDETTAGTLNNGGALVTNHLYMMTIEGRGVKAGSATTKLLVRGTYTIA